MGQLKHNKGRKLELCICNHCGKEFQKPQTEINRNLKLKRNNYCSRQCTGKHVGKTNFGENNNIDISKYSNNRLDNFTPFRYYLRNIRNRYKIVEVSLEDLKDQWEQQNGICEFSGVKLQLSSYNKIIKDPIYTASIDRIDSSKGYIKGNIKWVSQSINYMKNTMSEDMVWELCKLISNNYIKKGVQINEHL